MSNLRGLNVRLLQRITQQAAERMFRHHSYEIGVYFLSARKMTAMNQKFLRHEGPTDVITFDYGGKSIHGEIFICPDMAVRQAKEFQSTPPMELVRYVIHGLLHLSGYDDRQRDSREQMKKVEDKWVRWAAQEFPCAKVWSRKRAD